MVSTFQHHETKNPSKNWSKMELAGAAYRIFSVVYGARGWFVSDQDRVLVTRSVLVTHNRKSGIVRPRLAPETA